MGDTLTIVGFNFTKVHGERRAPVRGKISISNKVAVKEVLPAELALAKAKQAGVKFTFNYASVYQPDIGGIELEGELLYLGNDKDIKSLLDEWNKSKKISQDIMTSILNTVLSRCHVQSLIVSRDVSLPPSVPMPKVQVKK